MDSFRFFLVLSYFAFQATISTSQSTALGGNNMANEKLSLVMRPEELQNLKENYRKSSERTPIEIYWSDLLQKDPNQITYEMKSKRNTGSHSFIRFGRGPGTSRHQQWANRWRQDRRGGGGSSGSDTSFLRFGRAGYLSTQEIPSSP